MVSCGHEFIRGARVRVGTSYRLGRRGRGCLGSTASLRPRQDAGGGAGSHSQQNVGSAGQQAGCSSPSERQHLGHWRRLWEDWGKKDRERGSGRGNFPSSPGSAVAELGHAPRPAGPQAPCPFLSFCQDSHLPPRLPSPPPGAPVPNSLWRV